ncbi:hypothetical protein CS369_14300 [Candidatus Symbiopectobacterium sp. 'North America']|nr:hypothetical protein [Candidatus Symbiopectobacterium sp. 'North America']
MCITVILFLLVNRKILLIPSELNKTGTSTIFHMSIITHSITARGKFIAQKKLAMTHIIPGDDILK